MMRLILSIAALAFGLASALAHAEEISPKAIAVKVLSLDDETAAAMATGSRPVQFEVRRQGRAKASDDAYARVQAALQALARERSVSLAPDDAPAAGLLRVTVDPWFYVYTQRFNARRVYLAEYTTAMLAGQDGVPAPEVESRPGPDALRMLAGALGIVKGWVSPSFGSYMIAGGAREGLYGSGAAPFRGLLPDRERYERGEQEAVAKVTVSGAGVNETFMVVANMPGDAAPYAVDELTAATWDALMDLLGAAPRAHESAAASQ